ncbi:GNAT family N-acetyltransferase [Shimia thalassica]|uniref:GNAT family N-acetyltransferase n=1 Tax=Shimia thalassica TaxID=1715693 RepID=UPI002736C4ED|nr:GNAT family N-acetyltransferase [Shimia thalassica]MDP2578953.1 GNAT family N-acetyltransferase [Shimia thalassica]
MTLPNAEKMYEVVDATWPAAGTSECGPFLIREGKGGGKRVSAATAIGAFEDEDIASAEQALRGLGQTPLFQIREGDDALDAALEKRGYTVIDPVIMYAALAEDIATELPPRTAAIAAWEPLAMMREIWAEGGIGPERIEVMMRAKDPKTGFISRWQDKPAGSSFCAMHNGISMVHAVEIVPFQRRMGVGRWLMRRAAYWTLENGGHTLAVICTEQNAAANGLYASLGMHVVGRYHYRILQDD